MLGLRAHSGWAAMIALRTPAAAPLVALRARLQLIDSDGVAQPYHAAESMPLDAAAEFLDNCSASARALARIAIERAAGEMKEKGYKVAGACLLTGSGRTGLHLATILASHALIHTAEGDLFRDAVRSACDALRIPLLPLKEKDVWQTAETSLGRAKPELEQTIKQLGKCAGLPWRQDQKLCALAAWVAMAV